MRLIVVSVVCSVPESDIVFRSLIVSFRYALHFRAGTKRSGSPLKMFKLFRKQRNFLRIRSLQLSLFRRKVFPEIPKKAGYNFIFITYPSEGCDTDKLLVPISNKIYYYRTTIKAFHNKYQS